MFTINDVCSFSAEDLSDIKFYESFYFSEAPFRIGDRDLNALELYSVKRVMGCIESCPEFLVYVEQDLLQFYRYGENQACGESGKKFLIDVVNAFINCLRSTYKSLPMTRITPKKKEKKVVVLEEKKQIPDWFNDDFEEFEDELENELIIAGNLDDNEDDIPALEDVENKENIKVALSEFAATPGEFAFTSDEAFKVQAEVRNDEYGADRDLLPPEEKFLKSFIHQVFGMRDGASAYDLFARAVDYFNTGEGFLDNDLRFVIEKFPAALYGYIDHCKSTGQHGILGVQFRALIQGKVFWDSSLRDNVGFYHNNLDKSARCQFLSQVMYLSDLSPYAYDEYRVRYYHKYLPHWNNKIGNDTLSDTWSKILSFLDYEENIYLRTINKSFHNHAVRVYNERRDLRKYVMDDYLRLISLGGVGRSESLFCYAALGLQIRDTVCVRHNSFCLKCKFADYRTFEIWLREQICSVAPRDVKDMLEDNAHESLIDFCRKNARYFKDDKKIHSWMVRWGGLGRLLAYREVPRAVMDLVISMWVFGFKNLWLQSEKILLEYTEFTGFNFKYKYAPFRMMIVR